METTLIIITFCVLLLIAYAFDLTTSKTRIPAVILLLLLGWIVKQLTIYFEFSLPDFSFILPLIGTVGLILIVLEGSLELELEKSKTGLILKSFVGSLFSLLVMAFSVSFLFQYFGGFGFKESLINAIPLCIISSAIAIPSVRNIASADREFVIYESSLSDILGVLLFNFIALNSEINSASVAFFVFQLMVMIVISLVATVGLSFLLGKIEHHIKFIPIILLIILIYAVSKVYHLPALIFILIFGLIIGNFDKLINIEQYNLHGLKLEVKRFREITVESTFLVRSVFFILFGYLMETSEIFNLQTILWSTGIVALIFLIRSVQLKFTKLSFSPLLFVAPRGLITVLLFLSIDQAQSILPVNKSLVIQIVILTSFIMMFGLMMVKQKPVTTENELVNPANPNQ